MASAVEVDDHTPAPPTPYGKLGGSAVIRQIVERFYDLMDQDPAYAELRAMHAGDLGPMRQSLAGFLNAWCGGPRDWFEENPGKCMMSAHSGFTITPSSAAQWAQAMGRAFTDIAPEDRDVADMVSERLSQIAEAMGRMKS